MFVCPLVGASLYIRDGLGNNNHNASDCFYESVDILFAEQSTRAFDTYD